MEIQEKIEALRKEIEYHIERYYNQDDPEITDYEYDQKMNELKRLEREHPEYVTPDSPTQKVGGSAKREAGVLVEHNVPMLSLQDVFDRGEVENFVALRIRRVEVSRDQRRWHPIWGRCHGKCKSDP